MSATERAGAGTDGADTGHLGADTERASAARAFLGLLQRDTYNTVRHDLPGFLAQALLQPLAFLFVFGLVLPKIGAAGPDYGAQLLPGIIALTLVLTALQNVALPLVIEFSYTKEIEDRLLAPLPPWGVGLEKVLFSTGRAIVAAAIILPLGQLILPGGLPVQGAHWVLFVVLLVVGGFAGSAIGLVLGTLATEPDQRHLRRRTHAADLHRCDVLPVASLGQPALVPGAHLGQPAHLRLRGHARSADVGAAPRGRLDRARRCGLDGRFPRGRHAWVPAPLRRLSRGAGEVTLPSGLETSIARAEHPVPEQCSAARGGGQPHRRSTAVDWPGGDHLH